MFFEVFKRFIAGWQVIEWVALISIIELHLDNTRDPQQYRTVFERMYGKEAVQQAWAAVAEKGNPFYNLPASDETLENFKEHQALTWRLCEITKS